MVFNNTCPGRTLICFGSMVLSTIGISQAIGLIGLGCLAIRALVHRIALSCLLNQKSISSPDIDAKIEIYQAALRNDAAKALALACLIIPLVGVAFCRHFGWSAKPALQSSQPKEVIPTLPKPVVAQHATHQIQSVVFPVAGKINSAEFKKYILSDAHLTMNNRCLLENTVCVGFPPDSIKCHFISCEHSAFVNLCATPIKTSPKTISLHKEWFDYSEEDGFYIDFAHATKFGGAYRSFGCVQEERMFSEFVALSYLDFVTKGNVHSCIDKDGKGHSTYPPIASPRPFIVEGIFQDFNISQVPYGKNFHTTTDDKILKGIKSVPVAPCVNVLGIAAVDWRGTPKNTQYKLQDLVYHLEAVYLGNVGAKGIAEKGSPTIHSAPWGCGAFLNSDQMMAAIQILGARMANVTLHLHGVDNALNPGFTTSNIEAIITEIDAWIALGHSPNAILNFLLDKQKNDSSWAPKLQ